MGHVADGSHKPVVIPTLEGDHVHTVSPTVAQVPRTGCADETVAAFARFITDGDLAKRALSQSLRRDKALRPCLLIEWTGGAPGCKWLQKCLGGLSGEGAHRAVAIIGIDTSRTPNNEFRNGLSGK